MQFGQAPEGSEFEYRLAFDADEADVISAAYTEHITDLAKTGNVGSISAFDRRLANYSSDDENPYVNFRSMEGLLNILQTFHENTDTATTAIALEGGPDFDNWYVAERLRLGERTLGLIEELEGETVIDEFVRELDGLPGTDSRGDT